MRKVKIGVGPRVDKNHRFDTTVRCRNCNEHLLAVALRAKEGSCRPKVGTLGLISVILFANSFSREMQLFLLGYIIIEICEIFTVGEFPLKSSVRIVGFEVVLGFYAPY